MTLEKFEQELREIAPKEFTGEHTGIEIYFSDGYCQVLYGGQVIGAADSGLWGTALDEAIAWMRKNKSLLD